MNTDTKTVGDPDRFAFNENGSCDWHTSAGLCLERAKAMIDMLHAYIEGGSSGGLLNNTLESLTFAMQAELSDVSKLLDGWHHEQWQKERKKS